MKFRVLEQYGAFLDGTAAIRWCIQHFEEATGEWRTDGTTYDISVMKQVRNHIETHGAFEKIYPIETPDPD